MSTARKLQPQREVARHPKALDVREIAIELADRLEALYDAGVTVLVGPTTRKTKGADILHVMGPGGQAIAFFGPPTPVEDLVAERVKLCEANGVDPGPDIEFMKREVWEKSDPSEVSRKRTPRAAPRAVGPVARSRRRQAGA